MNMFARFDENPAMTLRVIKETKRYGRTDGRTDNVKTVYPIQTKFAGGIIIHNLCEDRIEKSVPQDDHFLSLGKPCGRIFASHPDSQCVCLPLLIWMPT